MSKVSKIMLENKLSWIVELTGIPLALDKRDNGYTLYLSDSDPKHKTRLKRSIAFAETKSECYQILKALLEVALLNAQK
jgi:hypothetical protein